jgi:uncharacterized membrane protein (UPF0127 family)
MSKNLILIGLILAAALIAGCTQTTASGNESSGNNSGNEGLSKVCFGAKCFYVELAVTAEEISRGLMFREHLDPDKGMLFIYKYEGVHYFWMKNTLIPLDMIWINSNREVISISKDVQPCQTSQCPLISPEQKVQYVLELNGGTSDKIGLALGDKITFDKSIEDIVE